MISTTKLKVMLSAEDMKKLDFDPCGGGDLSGRAAFRNILREARDRCGFDAVGERVFVQYYPEKHGGCEMFVTKLSKEDGELRFSVPVNMLYQSTRKAGLSSFLSMLRSGLMFIPTLIITTRLWGMVGIQISQPLADILTGLVSLPFVILFLRKEE